jgi:hypothetical protein
MQCYISVDNIPQFRLQVSEGNRCNFKVLNRCQALNYVTQKITNNICGNDKDPAPHFQVYTFRIKPNLNKDFEAAPHYSASEIRIRMSNFLKEICIFFNISIIQHYVVFLAAYSMSIGVSFQREKRPVC